MYRWFALVLTILASPACAQRPCVEQAQAYAETISGLQEEWQAITIRSETTPPDALRSEIALMRDIRRRTTVLDVPNCGQAAHAALLSAVDATIDAVTARQEQQPLEIIDAKRAMAKVADQRLTDAIVALGIASKSAPLYMNPLQSKIEGS
jgi:hypothetical protein